MKWKFRDEMWNNPNFVYNPLPKPFSGNVRGPKFIYRIVPTFMVLFQLFWTLAIMSDIVVETNLYATSKDPSGKCKGGENWEEFTVLELRAFMAMAIYMGMKKQPNYRTYWMWNSFFFCPKILGIFKRQ